MSLRRSVQTIQETLSEKGLLVSVELDDKTFRKRLARIKKEHSKLVKNLAQR